MNWKKKPHLCGFFCMPKRFGLGFCIVAMVEPRSFCKAWLWKNLLVEWGMVW